LDIIMTSPDQQNNLRSQLFQQRDDVINQLLEKTPGLWRATSQARGETRGKTQSSAAPHAYTQHGDLFADLPDPVTTERDSAEAQSSGYPALDELLPHGGWPQRGLVELICPHKGIGELQLLLPLLRERSHSQQSILWIAPPYPLHGKALQDAGINTRNSFVIPSQTSCNQALWSIEKALQSQECGLVLAWQNWLSARVIRRLQLAANEGGTLGILFHQRPAANSPATLQLQLSSPVSRLHDEQMHRERSIDVMLKKARGSYRQGQITLRLPC
jgi:cell division inhibitor SulA